MHAARPVGVAPLGGQELWRGDFEVAAPPGWEVTRNYRFFGNQLFTLIDPEGDAAVTIELHKENRDSRALPLLLVSDALTMNQGRSLGVRPELIAQHEILVAHRQAVATTVVRHHGPHERLVSQVALRGEQHLALIALHTMPGGYEAAALDWQLVLNTFDLPNEVPPPAPPLEDRLMFPYPEWEDDPFLE